MKYDGITLQRMGSKLPDMVKPTGWIEGSRLIFVLGNIARRHMVATLFIDNRQNNLYLRIEECPRFSAEDLLLRNYEPGVYVQLLEGARLSVDASVKFKPGLYELGQIIRLCHRRDFRRLFGESLCKLQAKLLRMVFHFHRWLLPGVYSISEASGLAPGSSSQLSEKPLSREEKYRLQKGIDSWLQHATRTRAIDPNEITPAIKHLYNKLRLREPRVVIVPSPLAAALAGSFATAIWHVRKSEQLPDSNSDVIANKIAERATLSDELFDMVRTACCIVEERMTEITRREISDMIVSTMSGTRADNLLGSAHREPHDAAICAPATVDTAVIEATLAALSYSNLERGRSTTNATGESSCPTSKESITTLTEDAFLWLSTRLADVFSGKEGRLRDLMIALSQRWFRLIKGRRVMISTDHLLEACKESNVLPPELSEQYQAWQKVQLAGAEMLMHDEFCIVSDFPERILVDEHNRPHCADGPSMRWRDGSAVYDWHGVRVTRQIIEAPYTLSAKQILSEPNVEVRRIMIQRYGLDRFITASGARLEQRDEFGLLYRCELDNDEDIAVVRVVNSTPEADGTFKEYYLRVPPSTRTAKEGISWTFGLSEKEYGPALQT